MVEKGQIKLNCSKCNETIIGRTYKLNLPVCFLCKTERRRAVARLYGKKKAVLKKYGAKS